MVFHRPLLGLLLISFFCPSCFSQLNTKTARALKNLENELSEGLVTDHLHAGISMAVIKGDQVIALAAYGFANTVSDAPADTNTIYRVGSITKTFTATLLMQLAEEKKLALDDTVEKVLPEIKNLDGYADAGPVTFRQLASHTAGLNREPDMKNASVGLLNDWEAKLLTCIPHTSFNSKPGFQFLYSNMGYALLGLSLQRITGVPYMQMVQDRILTPLHMDDTFFALPADKKSRMAQGIDNSSGKINTSLPEKEFEGRGFRVPNGGLYSTPRDLAKFVMSLMGKPPLVSANSLSQMLNIPRGGKEYGLGLVIFDSPDIIGHSGSVPGYTAQFTIDRRSGYAVILMRNQNMGSTRMDRVSMELLRKLAD